MMSLAELYAVLIDTAHRTAATAAYGHMCFHCAKKYGVVGVGIPILGLIFHYLWLQMCVVIFRFLAFVERWREGLL